MWQIFMMKSPDEWIQLQEKASLKIKQMIETKQNELNFLFEEQNKELQRAAMLNQSQKDVEIIVQRHLQDVSDLMQNASYQVQNNREKRRREFW